MSEEKKKLRRPVDEVRNELLNDADVKEQARLLKIPVEEYVDKILDYATHPEKPPALQIVSDEVLKAQDPSIPTIAEVDNHLQRIVRGEIPAVPGMSTDGFSKAPSPEQYGRALGAEDSVKYKSIDKSDSSQEMEASIPKPKFKP